MVREKDKMSGNEDDRYAEEERVIGIGEYGDEIRRNK